PPDAAGSAVGLPGHAERNRRDRRGVGDRADAVRAPGLHPRIPGRAAQAARDRRRRARLRRRLPRLGIRRGRLRLRCASRRRARRSVVAMTVADVAPALYDAVVVHSRREPIHRTFRHRICLWLVDLDHLPDPPRWARPFGRFDAADHLGSPDRSIRDNVDAWLGARGIDLTGGRVLMLANARALGHVFNPITLYWCWRADSDLECVVAEVHNTYGERHCYLLRPDPRGRADVDKAFYVS